MIDFSYLVELSLQESWFTKTIYVGIRILDNLHHFLGILKSEIHFVQTLKIKLHSINYFEL